MGRIISINDIEFEPRDDCVYYHDYVAVVDEINAGKYPSAEAVYRQLMRTDLWFWVYFVMGVKIANHPFVVDACREVQDGPVTDTLDLWAREHLKTTVLTVAETGYDIVRSHGQYPIVPYEERIAIISYSRSAALDFFHVIKNLFEKSTLLHRCFPDIFYANPLTEADAWSDEFGLTVKRKGNYAEATVEAWGLLDGMPTRKHVTKRVYDDCVTPDTVGTPEQIQKTEDRFAVSENLGTDGGRKRVIGTIYDHTDLYSKLRVATFPDGTPEYHVRVKPATENGEVMGKSVFQSEESLRKKRQNLKTFYCQQLLNPTPKGATKFDSSLIRLISPGQIPGSVWKFMVVDAAGEKQKKRDDAWAIICGAFEPFINEAGLSNLYLTDVVYVKAEDLDDATREITAMYLRNGFIRVLGVEKVGISTTEIHVQAALRAKGRTLTVEAGNLQILRPEGRSKEDRIESALLVPLLNGKIHISTAVKEEHRLRFMTELDRYPRWHDDGLDGCAYLYDLAKTYQFGRAPDQDANSRKDRWARRFDEKNPSQRAWLMK